MLFKLDENLPVEIAELLSDLGHDAKTIKDQRLQRVNDRVLLERCDKENFSDIRTYPPQEHEGIIILRVGNQSKKHVIGVFKRILPLIDQEPINKRLWLVEENAVRIRGENK